MATQPRPRSSPSPAWPTRRSTWHSNSAGPPRPGYRWCACTVNASPVTCSAASDATAGRNYLREAVERITKRGGYVLYLRQEGRGIGLYEKLDAYALQDGGLDTYDANLALGHGADERDYTSAAQMLHALSASRNRAAEQQPGQVRSAGPPGHHDCQAGPHRLHLNETNAAYLTAKARRGGHDLLSRSLERTAGLESEGEPHRHTGPAHLGTAD